jgi:hypothetical protein
MSATDAEPVPILDYAANPSHRPLSQRIFSVVFVVGCAIAGALLADRLQPQRYVAGGLLAVGQISGAAGVTLCAVGLLMFRKYPKIQA